MTLSLRNGALVLALLAGSALAAGPALADRGHHDRWDNRSWSKSWNKKHYKQRKHHGYAYRHGHGKKWHRGYSRYGWYGHGRSRHGWPGYYGRHSGFSIRIF